MKKYLIAIKNLDKKQTLQLVGGLFGILIFLFIFAPNVVYGNKILYRVKIGSVSVGGMNQEKAAGLLNEKRDNILKNGVALEIQEAGTQVVNISDIDFTVDGEANAHLAWEIGRRGSVLNMLKERLIVAVMGKAIVGEVGFDNRKLDRQIGEVAKVVDQPRKDIRLDIKGKKVGVLTDTEVGKIIDQAEAYSKVSLALSRLNESSIILTFKDDTPFANPDSTTNAKQQAMLMLKAPINLRYEDYYFHVSQEKIGSWITSGYDGSDLTAIPDAKAVEDYIVEIAPKLYTAPRKPDVDVKDGKVIGFKPPIPGEALEEKEAVEMILDILNKRKAGEAVASDIVLPVKLVHALDPEEGLDGIVELIGTATTPFTGSPRNRIHNIKNGIRSLSGIIIQPGQTFSTLGALGIIDDTTGYLPELVIKGDEKIPEFGGGLCQVSTTLFRAVMDSALPVLKRRNHSFRISYYEYDGTGKYIGPGLDATIYEPDVDFKFKNDTPSAILVSGYVAGDKVTFEIYGTKDGRSAKIEGPIKISEIPTGDPVYVDTDTLPKGTVKQVEKPHPGGTTSATYTITYADGTKFEQKFVSNYRYWPARFLVGTKE